jgi:hypothetical protein
LLLLSRAIKLPNFFLDLNYRLFASLTLKASLLVDLQVRTAVPRCSFFTHILKESNVRATSLNVGLKESFYSVHPRNGGDKEILADQSQADCVGCNLLLLKKLEVCIQALKNLHGCQVAREQF